MKCRPYVPTSSNCKLLSWSSRRQVAPELPKSKTSYAPRYSVLGTQYSVLAMFDARAACSDLSLSACQLVDELFAVRKHLTLLSIHHSRVTRRSHEPYCVVDHTLHSGPRSQSTRPIGLPRGPLERTGTLSIPNTNTNGPERKPTINPHGGGERKPEPKDRQSPCRIPSNAKMKQNTHTCITVGLTCAVLGRGEAFLGARLTCNASPLLI